MRPQEDGDDCHNAGDVLGIEDGLPEGFGRIRIGLKNEDHPGGIYVGRGTPFGNPFKATEMPGGREEAIERYDVYLQTEIQRPWSRLNAALKSLAHRVANGESIVLTCWCAPKRCHAEVIRDVVYDMARHLHTRSG